LWELTAASPERAIRALDLRTSGMAFAQFILTKRFLHVVVLCPREQSPKGGKYMTPPDALDPTHAPTAVRAPSAVGRPAYQAYLILYVGFVALPILAGLDKFFHLLVNWDRYLAPVVTQIIPVTAHTFMLAVGVIEIAAGVLVAIRPRIGAYVVALWLWGIIVNLILVSGYYDIALRDFGLSLGALALARLSQEFNHPTAR
jgi:hypothetical protein